MSLSTKDKFVATKSELRREIAELRSVGAQMSNVCFNLGQKYNPAAKPGDTVAIPNGAVATMRELRARWDAIRKAEVFR